ncbi:MAG: hypothetical protein IJC41_01765 [Firmicutes bacterium]|nr:hypothetical protein [Bacillota bacterium]
MVKVSTIIEELFLMGAMLCLIFFNENIKHQGFGFFVHYSQPQSISVQTAYIMSAVVFVAAVISLSIYLSFNKALKKNIETSITELENMMSIVKMYDKISRIVLGMLMLCCIKCEAMSLLAALVAYGIIIRIKIALMKKYLL